MNEDLPIWSGDLVRLYVVIRVERRNKRVRRQYYRLVEREKLRLAEKGVCQECVRLMCRYLSVFALRGNLKPCTANHNQIPLHFT